jgi:hypothetical protein
MVVGATACRIVWGSRATPDAARAIPDQPKRLSEPARQLIWEIEGKAFQISYKANPRLAAAIVQRDRAALLSFFASEFTGQLCRDNQATVRCECVELRIERRSEQGGVECNREQFVEWLLRRADELPARLNAELKLVHLSPDGASLDGAWRGTWNLRLYGEWESCKPAETVANGRFTAARLPDDLAHDTGWISSWAIDRVVAARANHFLMEDVAAQAGFNLEALHDNWNVARSDFNVTPGGAFCCDYNRDGRVDLLITDRGRGTLYAGQGGGRFEDVTLVAGIPLDDAQPSTAAAFADLDNDGDEDLVWGSTVLENRKGQFVRRGHLPVAADVAGISVADYDRDGLVDLYVSNPAPGPKQALTRTSWIDDESGRPNQLFRNQGNFQFQDVTASASAGGGRRSTFTAVWLDADDDGWPDVYVINELGPNILLRNEHNGTFSEHRVGPAVDGFAMGVSAGDLDDDGRIDLYLGNMFSKAGLRIIANIPTGEYSPSMIEQMNGFVAGNLLLQNRGDLRFEATTEAAVAPVGWAYGPALLDLDADGRLDIHSTAGFASFSRTEPDG